jgi:DNA-directed RNA polymerase subunit RPC12/RpoP
LKLSCVNCGAPLEIGPDLETFACSYCGTQQRVERKGGVVALKRVEEAIKQVQRGTDRTAAELALNRLAKELSEVQAGKNAAVGAELVRLEHARSSRMAVTVAAAGCTFFFLFIGLANPLQKLGNDWPVLGWVITAFATAFAAFFAYRSRKVSETERMREVNNLWEPRINKIKSQIQENRTLLDGH